MRADPTTVATTAGGRRGALALATLVPAARAVAGHPELWLTALRQLRLLTPDRWWRRAPFLPVPDAAYLRFRMETAYGDGGHAPEAHDVVTYLRWCRAWPHVTGSTGIR